MLLIGLYFGIYVLITIGLYHVLVVKLEAHFGTWPWVIFSALGLISLLLSLISTTPTKSMWWGYNAFLNLWTVKEMFDQPARRLRAKQAS